MFPVPLCMGEIEYMKCIIFFQWAHHLHVLLIAKDVFSFHQDIETNSVVTPITLHGMIGGLLKFSSLSFHGCWRNSLFKKEKKILECQASLTFCITLSCSCTISTNGISLLQRVAGCNEYVYCGIRMQWPVVSLL